MAAKFVRTDRQLRHSPNLPFETVHVFDAERIIEQLITIGNQKINEDTQQPYKLVLLQFTGDISSFSFFFS